VSTIQVSVTGSSDESVTVTGVNLYVDVDGDGIYTVGTDQIVQTGVTFPSDEGTALFSLMPAIQVPASSVVYLLVTFDLNASPGNDFQARIASPGDVTSVGAVSSIPLTPIGAPVAGGVKTAAAPGSPGSVEIRLGTNSPPSASVHPGTTGVAMMQLILRASSLEGVAVTGATISAFGTGNELLDVAAVNLYRDNDGNGRLDPADTLIALPETYTWDDGTVTFSGLAESVMSGSQVSWLVVYDFSVDALPGSFRAAIAQPADVSATGMTTSVALAVTGPPIVGTPMYASPPPQIPPRWLEDRGWGCSPVAGTSGRPDVPGMLLPLLMVLGAMLLGRSRAKRSRKTASSLREEC
jgi:hypothetical protein